MRSGEGIGGRSRRGDSFCSRAHSGAVAFRDQGFVKASVKVSWQITGVRQDAYAKFQVS